MPTISRKELRQLIFWSSYGLEKAECGSWDEETVITIKLLKRKFDIRDCCIPKIGKYTQAIRQRISKGEPK